MATEKRLIYANEAYEAVIDLSGQADTKSAYAAFWKAGKEIQKLPTVDAVEVVHGYTLPAEEPQKVFLDSKCGICGQLMLSTDAFCSMCGAKMDGGSADES